MIVLVWLRLLGCLNVVVFLCDSSKRIFNAVLSQNAVKAKHVSNHVIRIRHNKAHLLHHWLGIFLKIGVIQGLLSCDSLCRIVF